eukprot:144150_1
MEDELAAFTRGPPVAPTHPEDADETPTSQTKQQPQNPEEPEFTLDMIRSGPGDLKLPKTGPKGVMADYRQAQLRMRARRMKEKVELDRMIERMCIGTQQYNINPTIAPKVDIKKTHGSDSDSDSDFDEDDQEMFEYYREQRLKQIRETMQKFGHLKTLGAKDLPRVMDSIKPNVVMILHLCQDYVEACARMDSCLRIIAEQVTHILFCRIRVTDVLPKFSDVGLPTLVAIKGKPDGSGGDIIQNFVKVTDEIGEKFSEADIIAWLNKHKFMVANQIISPEEPSSRRFQMRARVVPDITDDSDEEFD